MLPLNYDSFHSALHPHLVDLLRIPRTVLPAVVYPEVGPTTAVLAGGSCSWLSNLKRAYVNVSCAICVYIRVLRNTISLKSRVAMQ